MFMIMFVLNDQKRADLVLDAWNNSGVSGTTLIESTGAFRRRMRIPGRYAYTTENTDENNITLIAIVQEESVVLNCLAETEKVIGDLSNPDTGIFSYWPLAGVKGLNKNYSRD
ncbi:MAG: hypothetical protein AB9907_05810 [Flexilinea sp.]